MPEGINPSEAVVATPTRAEEIKWMEASVWTPRMVEALVNGVKGGNGTASAIRYTNERT
jgi:hypothetical protein